MSPAAPSPAPDPSALACPVRACGLELALAAGSLRCERGHAFDLSRRGAVNLLQPQDRRAREPGDARAAVEARARVLERGLAQPLLAAVLELLDTLAPERARVLDVGCGTGWLLGALCGQRALRGVGVDLSSRAIELAARAHPGLTWVVANADRKLPLRAGVFDLALSVTGPKPARELQRVLKPAALLAVAVPAPDDLIELRAAMFGEGRADDRVPKTLELLSDDFSVERRLSVHSRALLDPDAQRDLLASTYRVGRKRREARATLLEPLEVTLAYDILCLRPKPAQDARADRVVDRDRL